MKPKFVSLFFVVLFFLPSLACGSSQTESVAGSGNIISQTIDVAGFDRVKLEGSGNVHIEQGQTERLSVKTDDNLVRFLDIKVSGRELMLGIKRGFDIHPSQPVTYNLTVRDLRNITLAGSGSFEVDRLQAEDLRVSLPGSGDILIDHVTAKELDIDLDGSGSITLDDVNAKIIDTSLRGSGDITLQGTTKEEEVVVRGSGSYRAGELQAKAAKVNIPGSADVTLWVTKELDIRISGDGHVQYYGLPELDQAGFGSGEITQLGEK